MTPQTPSSSPAPGEPAAKNGFLRRAAAAVLIGMLLYGLLWYTVFNAVTSALVASGGTVVLLAGASASDAFEAVFDTIANILLAILAAIGAVFAAIMSFFDW
jgi:hypothetical protein